MNFVLCIVLQIGQSHPTGLTANLLKLFEARPPLEFRIPTEKRRCPPYTGFAYERNYVSFRIRVIILLKSFIEE